MPDYSDPAFPGMQGLQGYGTVTTVGEGENMRWANLNQGISERDYFAAKAMQGLVDINRSHLGKAEIAREAYLFADAMLEAKK